MRAPESGKLTPMRVICPPLVGRPIAGRTERIFGLSVGFCQQLGDKKIIIIKKKKKTQIKTYLDWVE
jgi:hypothetical protein